MAKVYTNWVNRQYLVDFSNNANVLSNWLGESNNPDSFFYDSIIVDYSSSAFDDSKTIGEILRFDGELISDVVKNFVDYMIESYIKGHYVYEFTQVGKKWLEYYEKIIKVYKEKVINIFDLSGYEQKYTYIEINNSIISNIIVTFFDSNVSQITKRNLSVERDLIEQINEQVYAITIDQPSVEYKYVMVEYTNGNNSLLDYNFYELDDSFDTLPQMMKYHTQEFKKKV